MRTKHLISFVLFAIAAGLMIWWAETGHQMWASTQHLVTVETKDELFGTVTQTQHWEQQFIPGLEFIGPLAALLIAVSIWFSMKSHKERMIIPTGHMTEDERLMHYDTLKKNGALIYGLWFLFGWMGAHRSVEGRIWSGFMMFTFSIISLFLYVIGDGPWGFIVVGVWWVIDLFLIGGWVRNFNEELIARLEGHIKRTIVAR